MEKQNEEQKNKNRGLWVLFVVLLFIMVSIFASIDIDKPEPDIKASENLAQTAVNDYQEKNNEDATMANKRLECKEDAYKNYLVKWNKECHNLGKEDSCTMPPVNYLPINKEKADAFEECYKNFPSKTKFKDEEAFLKELEREKCLNQAEQYYIDKWDSQCSSLGRAKDCTLPIAASNNLDEMLRGQRNECYMKYPTK